MDFESFMKSSISESKEKFENKDASLPQWSDEESEEETHQAESLKTNKTPTSDENSQLPAPKISENIPDTELLKNNETKTSESIETSAAQEIGETKLNENKRKHEEYIEDPKDENDSSNEVSSKKQRTLNEEEQNNMKKQCVTDTDLTIETTEIATNPEKVALQIRQYIKNLLAQWTTELNERETKNDDQDDEKDPNFEREKELLLDTKKSLIPLLVLLKKGNKEFIEKTNMFPALSTVIHYLQIQNFLKANEAYASLSIGNVAWPIGVIGVGIHARSAQSKITGIASMANVMLDEVTRKWITCVKRLITYCEKHHS